MEQQDKDRDELLVELSELRSRVSRLESEREMLLGIQAKLGNALQRLNALGRDTVGNINLWTAVCGEWLDGTYALYYRLKDNSLEPLGRWNTVENFQSMDKAEGYICHDVITKVGDETFIIRDLQNSAYTETDPSVKKYGLQTCIGKAIKVGGEHAGCLCLFFKEDHAPSPLDMAIIAICSMSIEREEGRHLAEVTLKENESRYRQLAENSPTGIFIYQDGKSVYVNKRFAEMLGYSPEEMLGWNALEAICPDDRELFSEKACTDLKGESSPLTYEIRFVTKTGEIIRAQASAALINYQDRPALMVNLVDITDRKKAEEALHQSEERFKTIFDFSPFAIAVVAPDGASIVSNTAFLSMMGYTSEELQKLNFTQFTYPGDLERELPLLKEILDGKRESYQLEKRNIHKDGSLIWLNVHIVAVRDDAGELNYLIALGENITDRKKAEEALRESEEHYRAVFDSAVIGIDLLDRNGNILKANNALLEMLGYTEDELRDLNFLAITHTEDKSVSRRNLEAITAGEMNSYRFEKRYLRKDGDSLWADVSVSAIRDENEEFAGIVGVIADITERKLAEERLRASENRFRAVMDQASDAFFIHNLEGQIIDANEKACQSLCYTKEELLTKTIADIDPVAIKKGKDKLWESLIGGKASAFESYHKRKDGSTFPIEVSLGAIQADQEELLLAIVRDITERKEAEEERIVLEESLRQAHKMEAVGTLAGGVAHDFNNLLQIISGYAELLETELAKRDMKFSEIAAIRQSADRGADLVKQLLTFSRRVESKFEIINLNDNVRETERLLYRTIPKMIEIELILEEGLKPVRADSTQMEQLLINIAVNAQEAMPDGGKLTIETRNVNLNEEDCIRNADLSPGPYVLLKVSDTGHGVDEELLPHIFDPFFTDKGLAEGTGLGLATVFGIVKMHEGHIACESEASKGTTFNIYFPASESASPKVQQAQEVSAVAGGTETILVVDDEGLIAGLAKRILENTGYSVITAVNGREALEIYERE